jgi:HEAT repeat protein
LTEEIDIIKGLEIALKNLTKLIKAVQYYPPAHPTLRSALNESSVSFLALIPDDSELLCSVRKEGFFHADKPVGPKNPILIKFAAYLFARRINHLMFLPDLDINDLQAFARCLTMEANEVQKMGGIKDLLAKARVSTIWVNVVEPAQFMELKKEIEEQKEKFVGDQEEDHEEQIESEPEQELTAEERSLEKVLRELQNELVDQRFRYLLQELIPHIHLNLTPTARPLILDAINYLNDTAEESDVSAARRKYCQDALAQLASEDILDYLVAILCSKDIWDALREATIKALVSLKGKVVVWRLMDHLAEESNGQVRKYLAEVLIRQNMAALPILLEYLDDDRWFVARNAIVILGEIRNDLATDHLKLALHHRDVRVRREAIRSLTKIGGNNAIGILLRTVSGEDVELSKQALLSLGAMKCTAAVPTLVNLVRTMGTSSRTVQTKREAIKALGDIGSNEATAALIETLQKKSIWKRRMTDDLRSTAALALAQIGGEESIKALTIAADDKSEIVARAATKALKQLKRNE